MTTPIMTQGSVEQSLHGGIGKRRFYRQGVWRQSIENKITKSKIRFEAGLTRERGPVGTE